MNMLPRGIFALVLTRIVLAHEAPMETSKVLSNKFSTTLESTRPVMTTPPNVYFERDIEALLSSFERLASKASDKGSSIIDEGETFIKDKASAVSTAVEGKETLISDKLEEINSRVMSAMVEAVTQLNGDDDDRISDGANLNVHRSAMTASAILGLIIIGFFIT